MDDKRKWTVGLDEITKTGEKRRRVREKPGVPAPVQAQPEVPAAVEAKAPPVAAAAPARPALPVIGSITVEHAASLAPSAALVGVGLLLESELLVGIAIGTGIAMAAKWAPEPISGAVLPVVNSTLMACYTAAVRTGQMLGDAIERIEGAITGMVGPSKPPEAPKIEERQPLNGSGDSADQASHA
jgi:hypothetical protein